MSRSRIRMIRYAVLAVFMASLLSACTVGLSSRTTVPPTALPFHAFPAVDPAYIYDQLFTMATQFQHREAGYDTNLPLGVNGHDEFAAYWTQEMQRQLAGFAPVARRSDVPVAGWRGRSASVPAFNMEVSVAGMIHPEQVVVIGCHYDGEAISTQSANDDASGCAIELGVARAMATYWRDHHTLPSRTLRFVLFDAEEQGLFGSFDYINQTIAGGLPNVMAMINEEQSGIAYPVRFLGKTSNSLLPLEVDLAPLGNNQLYPTQSQLGATQRQRITRFNELARQSVAPVFQQFQALGYTTLAYHGASGEAQQPIFASDQTRYVELQDDTQGSSDQMAFTLAGVPCATLVGNSTYYTRSAPPWSYPYDQPEDTIQLMNVFASGKEAKSQALTLALAVPGMMTTWLLSQPDILGESAPDGAPVAAFASIGQAVIGQQLTFDAQGSYGPAGAGSLSYTWQFGDGTSATGVRVNHTYAHAGQVTLTLTIQSPSGVRVVNAPLVVTNTPTPVPNPYADANLTGAPLRNPNVMLPTPAP